VLYIALVVMVVMMLAGVAVLRSVGAGQGVAGNLAFKQNATSAGDRGVVAALAYLRPAAAASAPSAATLAADQSAAGYFASWTPAFDPANFAWDTDPAVVEATANDGTGNRVRYVIHRLCRSPGALEGNVCVEVHDASTLEVAGGGASSSGIAPPPPPPYFRVTTRVDGPRNTVSYTQIIMK
jgi:Tfp pilus assembly protein PilX